jgi:aspartyl-tRNA(Asn)/glutamyl-tRNA(Gln) amidotransferase subunit C
MSALTKEEIKKIASLGRLALTEEEIEKYSNDLTAILDYVEQLNELDTTGVEPMVAAVTHIKERRHDNAVNSGVQDLMLANAPETELTAIKVPKMN